MSAETHFERLLTRLGRLRARSGSKLPTANVPLRALDGRGAKDDFISVGVRSALFGVLRFG